MKKGRKSQTTFAEPMVQSDTWSLCQKEFQHATLLLGPMHKEFQESGENICQDYNTIFTKNKPIN